MSQNINHRADPHVEKRVAAVVVPKHLHREVQTFVEQLMADGKDVDTYSSFVEEFLARATSGSKQVTTSPEAETSGGDVVEIGYES